MKSLMDNNTPVFKRGCSQILSLADNSDLNIGRNGDVFWLLHKSMPTFTISPNSLLWQLQVVFSLSGKHDHVRSLPGTTRDL